MKNKTMANQIYTNGQIIINGGPVEYAESSAVGQQNNAKRAYVSGLGWCWMRDGEIIEIIEQENEGLNERTK